MQPPPFELETAHRWFAVECNNGAWDLLETADRSAAEDQQMVHLAHAACWHWWNVGTAVHQLRALYLLGRVHEAVGDGAVALRYARQCVDLCQQHGDQITDFDRACGHECLARALAAVGDTERARRHHQRARQAADQIAEAEDKQVFEQLFSAGNWHGIA